MELDAGWLKKSLCVVEVKMSLEAVDWVKQEMQTRQAGCQVTHDCNTSVIRERFLITLLELISL